MNSASSKTIRATTLLLISACSFGSLTTWTLLIMRSGLPLLTVMFWRYLLATGALLLLSKPFRKGTITRKQALNLILVGGFGQAVITYLSLRALDYLPVGTLAFLFYTYPAWLGLISAVTGREAMTTPRLTALILATSGIIVMLGAPGTTSLSTLGVILALGTALLFALYLPALHAVQAGIPPAVSTFYLLTGVLIAFTIAAAVTGNIRIPQSLIVWNYIMLLAFVSTAFAFVTLIAGLRVLGPVRTSIISTIEPFFTGVLGVLVLGESLTLGTIGGGAMIASAVVLLQLTAKETQAVEGVG